MGKVDKSLKKWYNKSVKQRRAMKTYTDIVNDFSQILDIRGMECGVGWCDMIYRCLQKIDRLEPQHVTITQIGEKGGMVQIKYAFNYKEGENCLWQIDKINEYIREAAEESLRTCEYCGKPGKFRNKEWRRVTCDECEDYYFGN